MHRILVGDSFIGVENDEANDFIAKLKAVCVFGT